MLTEEEKINILRNLVEIKSVNDNELAVANYLKNLLKEHDIESTLLPISETRANLLVELGEGKPVFGWSGHMDVVAANPDDWDYNPFALTQVENKLYGRGSTDMKSGLAAMMIALIELKMENKEIPGTIRLMATVGEEVGGAGSDYFYKNGYMDDVDALLISEPSSKQIVFAHKGSLNLKLTSIGKAAHSSMPELGFNAIDALITVIQQANHDFRSSDLKNELLGKLTFNTDIITGGNQVNSIPDTAVAEINVRTIPEFTTQQVLDELNQIIKKENASGADISVEVTMNELPVQSPENSTLANLAAQIGKTILGEEVKRTPMPGVTDASHLLQGKDSNFPFIMFGPGVTKMAHQANEYVLKDEYLNFIDIFKLLAQDYK